MVKGQPDYQGVVGRQEVTTRQNLLFPGGRAILIDDFSSPAEAFRDVIVGAGQINLQIGYPFTAPACAYMLSGAVIGNYSMIYYETGLPRTEQVGVECAFAMQTGAGTRFYIEVRTYDLTNLNTAEVYFSYDNNSWYYLNAAGGSTMIPNSTRGLRVGLSTYHRVKLIVDFANAEYMFLYVDDRVYDLRGIAVNQAASAIFTHIRVVYGVYSETAVIHVVRIDNVSITEEEL
ncbi:hypothetical protein AYK26_07020 [Euryarchaeota archaeon SM23-78]|nr:MAG: hypothetical protein AYK26_07020 [Euryarchaeota archaeon SM23-78]